MKKITLSIIFIFICFASHAHIGHYSKYKKIEMDILRNNELIGYNYYFFSQKNDVENFGLKLKLLSELQYTLGIFLIDKNILYC